MRTGIAAKAPLDGHTMVIVAAGYAAGASLYKNLPYDPVRARIIQTAGVKPE